MRTRKKALTKQLQICRKRLENLNQNGVDSLKNLDKSMKDDEKDALVLAKKKKYEKRIAQYESELRTVEK